MRSIKSVRLKEISDLIIFVLCKTSFTKYLSSFTFRPTELTAAYERCQQFIDIAWLITTCLQFPGYNGPSGSWQLRLNHPTLYLPLERDGTTATVCDRAGQNARIQPHCAYNRTYVVRDASGFESHKNDIRWFLL